MARLEWIKLKMLSIIAVIANFDLLLSPAAPGFGLRLGPSALCLRRSGGTVGAVSLPGAQLEDLVTQGRRPLEFKLFSGIQHLGFEVVGSPGTELQFAL